ncbi:MAG: hypothetical protein MUD09_03915 [Desulfobacterales bacterium]|jgi:hypothetical protein|nr:hypothetical protein [Desulfobacterales bacterium]
MGKEDLMGYLTELREIILAERQAAKELEVDKLVELAAQKECLLKKILPLSNAAEQLTLSEKELSETVYSENLRNAYFFWSALKWVRESMGFIGDKMYPESYEENGSVIKGRYSGALLSGRV